MRKIKFRAWYDPAGFRQEQNMPYKGMYYFDFDNVFGGELEARSTEGVYVNGLILTGSDSCKVMQYTGLKDLKGVEIYEGDIVNLIPQGYAIVSAIVQWADKELRWVCHRPKTDTGSYLTSNSEVEVIGNIYENKELLNES